MTAHETYMQRAIELARRGEGNTSPNPLVGCVIVKDQRIVAEGWHHKPGAPHGEIEALRVASETKGATLYVNLEPCAHHGRTPPCTEAIVAASIARVVYAIADPNPRATGGAAYLARNGIEVVKGIAEEEATELNRFFLHHTRTRRPYVIAKFAASLDGRIATRTGQSQWITGDAARQRGHTVRQAVDAILVGAQTVVADNPRLTTRLSCESRDTKISHPIRVILDSTGRVPLAAKVFDDTLSGQTIVATTERMPTDKERQLLDRGVDVIRTAPVEKTAQVDIDRVLTELGARECQSVLVEGGPAVLGAFLDQDLIDEVWAFLAPMLIGGNEAKTAIGGAGINQLDEAVTLRSITTETIGKDLLVRGVVKKRL